MDEEHEAVVQAARVAGGSRLYGDALFLMASGLLEAGTAADENRAIRVARTYLEQFPDGEHAGQMRLMLGRQLFERDGWEEGASHLYALMIEQPLSKQAEEAQSLLESHREELPGEYREKLEHPPKKLHMARLEALFDRHRSEKVVERAGERVDGWTPGSRPRCRLLYWIGRSQTKLREHADAAEWYERILEECDGIPPFEKKALYLVGKSYWNSGERQKALDRFERLWSDFEDHSYADDVMYFAARIYRELDEFARADEVLTRQVERYPDGDMAANAHWMRVRRLFKEEDYAAVVEYVDGLDSTGEEGPATRGRLEYFRARALHLSDKDGSARKAYREVAEQYPLSLYALFALNRLARLEGVETDDLCDSKRWEVCQKLAAGGADAEEGAFEPELPQSVRSTAAYAKGVRLLQLGIREWAEPEFDRLFDQFAHDRDAILAIADLIDRAGAHDFSYGLPGRIQGWEGAYPADWNRRPWTIAYPRAFEPIVDKYAGSRGLDESLVWGIMRKESGYNATIESWANARGLMQLMVGTAGDMAERVGIGSIDPRDLLDPETNVRLGTAYLDFLSEKVDARPALVAAGYNAGNGNVSEWLEERGDLPLDIWIEEIPFGQTRKYVKLVLRTDWTYRWLYDGPSVPKVTFELGGASD